MSDTPLVRELRLRLAEIEAEAARLHVENADLKRQVEELRAAVAVLMDQKPPI